MYIRIIYRFKERKLFYAGKGMKPKITITDASSKFTRPSRIPATQPGTSSKWHRPTCQHRQNRIHVFNPRGDISILKGGSLKLVDKFTYLRSSISSTEKDINMQLAKAWIAIDRLLVIWKLDLTNEIQHSFFQAVVVSLLLHGCMTWMLTKCMGKTFDGNYTRML